MKPKAGVYFKILRNDVSIDDDEIAHLTSISFTDSYIEGSIKNTTLEFTLSSSESSHSAVGEPEENLNILEKWMFSQNQSYKLYMGRTEEDSQFMMKGAVMSVHPRFGADGLITFSVVISNQMFADPQLSGDQASPVTFDKGVSAYDILSKTAQERGIKFQAENFQIDSELRSYTYANGYSRMLGQTTTQFLHDICTEFSIYLDEINGKLIAKKVDYTKRPELYFKYRPNAIGEEDVNLMISFEPTLDKPGFFTSEVNGINPDTGTITRDTTDNTEQRKKANKVDIQKQFSRDLGVGGEPFSTTKPIELSPQAPITQLLPPK